MAQIGAIRAARVDDVEGRWTRKMRRPDKLLLQGHGKNFIHDPSGSPIENDPRFRAIERD